MDSLAVDRIARHLALSFTSRRQTEFIDITDQLDQFVRQCGARTGLLTVQTLHTTTAVVVNEGEPLLLADFERSLERTIPRSLPYWHDEMALRAGVHPDEPANGHAHCRALLLPTSVVLTVAKGALRLGRWQRVFLVELDGPRHREASAVLLGGSWLCE